MRAVKTIDPKNTIKKIYEIFNNLNLSIDAKIEKNNEFYTSIVRINGNKYLTQYGKGINEDLALASGLAELMERLQSLYIFNPKIREKMDELLLNYHDIYENRIQQNTIFNEFDGYPQKAVYSKFLDVINNSFVELPINYLINNTGSSGFCAGNNYFECAVGGICECFERYSLIKLFENNYVPPIIDNVILKEKYKNYHFIEKIKNKGLDLYVFDLSMGIGLPVVGVMLLNKDTGKYLFHAGSEPIFQFALDRCITEAYQGLDIGYLNSYDNNNLQFYKKNTKISQSDILSNLTWGTGSLALNNILLKENTYNINYEFIDYIDDDNTFKKSYYRCIEIISKLNKKIYIKDFSYLGFITLYIYITDISNINNNEIFNFKEETKNIFEVCNKESFYLNDVKEKIKTGNIKWLNEQKNIEMITNFIEKELNGIKYNLFNVHPFEIIFDYPFEKNEILSLKLIYVILLIRQEKYKKALNIIDNDELYYEKLGKKKRLFYIIRDFVCLKLYHEVNNQQIFDYLSKIYSSKLIAGLEYFVISNEFLQSIFVQPKINYEFEDFINIRNSFLKNIKEIKINLENISILALK